MGAKEKAQAAEEGVWARAARGSEVAGMAEADPAVTASDATGAEG